MLQRITMPKGFNFVLPLLFLIVLLFDLPLIMMLGISISNTFPTFEHYLYLIQNPVYLQILLETFKMALIVTICAILIGYPLAYWMTELSKRNQVIVVAIVLMSFLVSILVRTYAWIIILGNNGIINNLLLRLGLEPMEFLYNEFGVTLGTLNVLLPFIVIPLYAAMLKIDKQLLKAAASLGANPFIVFIKVYLPLTLPPLGSSAMMVFIITLGFFITPAILGGGNVPMISNVLEMLINQMSSWELASALSVILLIATFLLYFVYAKIVKVVRS